MNETTKTAVKRYFEERIAHYEALMQALRADGREDEAVFARVQGNVYDIFNTVFDVAVKTGGEDDAKVVDFFLTRLQQIPQNWSESARKAEQHGESEKLHTEQLKLEAAAEIRKRFSEICEVRV